MMQQRQEARELANGHWREILIAAGIDGDVLHNRHAVCPLCGSLDKRWFRFDDKEGRGTYYCNSCGAGDGFKLLMTHLGGSFNDAATFVRRYFGNLPVSARQQQARSVASQSQDAETKRRKRRKSLARVWSQARPILVGDAAWRYLTQTRRLPMKLFPRCMRFHPRLAYRQIVVGADGKEQNKLIGYFPALLVLVTNPDGTQVNIHRTYLTEDGRKAPVEKPKKLMSGLDIKGGAMRLMEHGDILGVAEGLESAYAARALTGIPTWATISAGIMQNFEPPAGVTKLVIFSDNDKPDARGKRAGQDAAAVLKERMIEKGIEVRVIMATTPGSDIHDAWIGRLNKQRAKAR